MEQFLQLNNDNFFQFALKYYDNPSCRTAEEFNRDLQRFTYIKKAFNKKIPDVHLILNHIRIQYNVFHPDSCTKMLFFKCNKEVWPRLKPFIIFLSYMPDNFLVEVPLDNYIVNELRKIKCSDIN